MLDPAQFFSGFGQFQQGAVSWIDVLATGGLHLPAACRRLDGSVNQAAELMKQRDELLAALEAARRLIELISPFEGDVTRQIDRAIASGKAVPDEG